MRVEATRVQIPAVRSLSRGVRTYSQDESQSRLRERKSHLGLLARIFISLQWRASRRQGQVQVSRLPASDGFSRENTLRPLVRPGSDLNQAQPDAEQAASPEGQAPYNFPRICATQFGKWSCCRNLESRWKDVQHFQRVGKRPGEPGPAHGTSGQTQPLPIHGKFALYYHIAPNLPHRTDSPVSGGLRLLTALCQETLQGPRLRFRLRGKISRWAILGRYPGSLSGDDLAQTFRRQHLRA